MWLVAVCWEMFTCLIFFRSISGKRCGVILKKLKLTLFYPLKKQKKWFSTWGDENNISCVLLFRWNEPCKTRTSVWANFVILVGIHLGVSCFNLPQKCHYNILQVLQCIFLCFFWLCFFNLSVLLTFYVNVSIYSIWQNTKSFLKCLEFLCNRDNN